MKILSYADFWHKNFNFFRVKNINAFTLAEMMVVLLIMSIILAAMAPVMTTRMRSENNQSTIWRWAGLDSIDAYFGVGNSQSAMIGQSTKAATDSGKLIINTPDDSTPVLELKNNGSLVANIQTTANSLLIGTMTANSKLSSNTVAIGRNLKLEPSSASANINNSIVIGEGAKTTRNNAIAIGSGASVGGVNATGTVVGYGEYSVVIGNNAKAGGDRSIAIGSGAGDTSSSTSNNIAIGYNAGVDGGLDTNNRKIYYSDSIAIGRNAKNSSYQGVSIGPDAGSRYGSSYGNIAIGRYAGQYASHVKDGIRNGGDNNISIGSYAGQYASGGDIAIGYEAIKQNSNYLANGGGNIAIGWQALKGDPSATVTNVNNVAIGFGTMSNAQGGAIGNTAVGGASMVNITTGSENVSMGWGSLFQNTTGRGNTSIGAYSLWNHDSMPKFTTGDYNTALGYYACDHVQGSRNTCVGSRTTADGFYNYAMKDYNTAIGHNACIYTTGSYNTCIGADSGPLKDQGNVDHTIFLGSPNETVYIQGNLVVDGHVLLNRNENSKFYLREGDGSKNMFMFAKADSDGKAMRGSSSWGTISVGPFSSTGFMKATDGIESDRRLKYVGNEFTSGLDKIRQLKVFNFTYKKDDKKVPHVGVIAQDLQKVFPNAVKKGSDGFLMIRQEDMFYALVNAVKELDAKISVLIENQKQILKELNALRKENQELRKRLDKLERR